MWCGDMPLKVRFLRLYYNSKGGNIGDVGEWIGNEWVWKLSRRRTWFEWEKPMLEDIHIQVARLVIHRDNQDVWCGKMINQGVIL